MRWLLHFRTSDGELLGVWHFDRSAYRSDLGADLIRYQTRGRLTMADRTAEGRNIPWGEWVDNLTNRTPHGEVDWGELVTPDSYTAREALEYALTLR